MRFVPGACAVGFLVVALFTQPARAEWWCATNFFDHHDRACWESEEQCQSKNTGVTNYQDCVAQTRAAVLSGVSRVRGPVFAAFPELSYCTKARRTWLKDPDLRSVAACLVREDVNGPSPESAARNSPVSGVAAAKSTVKGIGSYNADAPHDLNVSEVSKDGDVIHNRVTFSCIPAGARRLECVVVQQALEEPTAQSASAQDKEIAEIGDVLTLCKDGAEPPKSDEPRQLAQVTAKFKKACQEKDASAILAAVRGLWEYESQICTLTTVVRRVSFTQVNNDTWISHPDPQRMCVNIAVTQTLRRDPHSRTFWNYTEAVVAKPSAIAPTLCQGTSGTTEFTWDKAVTPYDLKCRYVAM